MGLFYFILGTLLFLLQILLFSLVRINLDLVTLVIFHLSRVHNLVTAVGVALGLGLLADCFSISPLGLHAGALLPVIFATRFLRGRFNLQSPVSQILVVLCIIIFQGLTLLFLLSPLESVSLDTPHLWTPLASRAAVTALVAPPLFALLARLEKSWGRYFFRSRTALP